MLTKYDPFRGGHAPGNLREEFQDAIDSDGEYKHLIGKLWNCTDCMPASLCEDLDLPQGSTYAQGVRKLKREMES